LGAQYLDKGDLERSVPFFEEALATSRRSGDRRNIAMTIRNLAEVARQKGEYERAKTLGMECLSLYQELGDELHVARTVGWLGMLAFWNGDDHDLSERTLKEGLALNREIGNWGYAVYCLEGLAGLAGARAQGAPAARLWGAAEALRTNIGAPPTPETRPYYEPSMAAARALLGEAAWEAAFAQGIAMSAEEAAEYALSEDVVPAPERPPAGGKTDDPLTTDPLTAREREVAAMVAQGMSNRQIASEIFLSEHTVKRHISKILRKLGLASRAEVAAWATERLPLTPPFE
jgi:DNA-binding CsgD family transcriptional regulator